MAALALGGDVIAALYVDRRGPYWDREGVDAWDIERDARLYKGPHPVVAHPPCHLWVNMAAVNWKRYGRQRPASSKTPPAFADLLISLAEGSR